MHKIFRSLLIISLLACSAGQPVRQKVSTARSNYEEALAFKKNSRWESAIEKFELVKHRFPLSSYAKKAELELADIYFQRKNWIEARAAYDVFKQFHPEDKNLDFVQYRLGLTFFNEIPSAIDRNLEPAKDTIYTLSELVRKYPQSKYVSDAKEKIKASKKKLALRDLYIARYYHKTKSYTASLGRALDVTKKFSSVGLNEEAYFYIIYAYDKLNNKKGAKEYLKKMQKEFPNSKYLSRLKI